MWFKELFVLISDINNKYLYIKSIKTSHFARVFYLKNDNINKINKIIYMIQIKI